MRLALAALLVSVPALAAAERVPVRSGDHPGHGRLVFDWPAPPAYSLEQQGDRILLRFPPGSAVQLPRRLPRNLVEAAEEPEGVRLTLRPGARVRHFRLGGRVVVDLLDPAAAVPARPPPPEGSAPRPPREARALARPEPAGLPPPAPPVAPAAPVVAEAQGAPQAGARMARAPVDPAPAVAAAPAATPAADLSGAPAQPPARAAARLAGRHVQASILLPFPNGTGAALLRRAGEVLAVFDSPEVPDLRPLRGDPVFGAMTVETLPGGTILRLPAAASGPVRARPDPAGWVLDASPPPAPGEAAEPAQAIAVEVDAGPPPRLLLRVAAPGRVVPVPDPETGLPLLVATLREGTEAMPTGRRLPELDLPPTLLGAAVLARSDGVAVQPGNDRFLVTAAGGARLALDPGLAGPPAALAMTRSFDLPAQPAPELQQRFQGLQAAIAAAPPLARLPQRRAAGETLLALGLPQEAQAVLALGFGEDPRAAADPRYAALAAAAALLAGRLAEAGALRATEWPASDEATLWRAALSATQSEWQAAAPGFAATLPLLLAYPSGLRARLLPLAALTLAEAGERAALQRLLDAAGPAAGDLELPRAILAEAEGRTEDALAAYDRIAAGRDRRARARATRRAVELRLATGRMDAQQAARALEAALLAWRSDAAEIEARLRLAALRRDAGDGRGALALLRETAAMAPDQAAALQPALHDAFLAALSDSPPLAAVALFDAYPDLLPADSRGEAAALLLAERLLALDLGDRAALLLRQAMTRAEGSTRAALGHRLAALRLAEGDAQGALSALADSAAEALPPALARDRAVLAARAEARRGRREEAIDALRALGPAGSEALSELLADSADWSGAAAALGAHVSAMLPRPPEPLGEEQRRMLLHQAALLALAGEDAALAELRSAEAARMGEGPLAEAFALLTADPLRGLADLPRLQRELQLFRSLPARLEALRTGTSVTR